MAEREELKDLFDVWYGDGRYRTKSLSEYIVFLKNLLDEILYLMAHICRDIRRLEGRE